MQINKTISFLLIPVFLISQLAVAEVVVIDKGQPAPFTGILMDENTAKDNQKELLELDALKGTVGLYKANIEISEAQIEQWKKSSLEAHEALQKRDRWANLKAGLWFGGGAATTILLFFAVKKSAN